MTPDSTEGPRRLSRADILKRGALVGAAATIPAPLLAAEPAAAAPQLHAVEALTSQQFQTLSAMSARLFPTDGSGPGAAEAHAATYIDKALASHYTYQQDAYTTNLAAVDAYATATFGAAFAGLPADKQDLVLTAMERNTAPKSFGFNPDALTFFNLVLAHTQEGMFSDPYYGGNANFVGWDLLGFPGVKLEFTAADQRLNVPVAPSHRSTYSYDRFKAGKGA